MPSTGTRADEAICVDLQADTNRLGVASVDFKSRLSYANNLTGVIRNE